MLKRKSALVFAAVASILACSNVLADEFLDTKSLLKDVVASNAGTELIVPFFKEVDNNGDDYPDKIAFNFKVYDAGTTSKLFATTKKQFVPPANPCANPSFLDWDWDASFVGEGDDYTGAVISFYVECFDSVQNDYFEEYKTFLYMADTSSSSGTVWSKIFAWETLSVDIVNWDADGADEVQLFMVQEADTSERGRVVFFNKTTGVKESDKQYQIGSFFD